MADAPAQSFDTQLLDLLIDLDGDGRPDAVVQAPPMTNRERGMIQRRAMAGREPSPVDQARLQADMPRLEENSNRLAAVMSEATGIPAVSRGYSRAAEGVSEGAVMKTAGGVGEMALGMMPYASASRPVFNALMGSAPRSMATTGALALPMGVADVQEAQAQTLTRRQRREMEMEGIRRQQEAEAEKQRLLAEAEAEKRRQLDQIEVSRQQEQSARMAREEEQRIAREKNSRPWRERNPELAAALPALGYAFAAGVPAVGAALRNVGSYLPGSAASRMNRAANQGETLLLKSGNQNAATSREIMLRRDQLTNYLENQPSAVAEFATNRLLPAAAGGVLAYEGRVFPDQMDMRDVNLTPEQRQQALQNVFDSGGFGLNVLLGGLTGLSAQEAVDRLIPKKTPDVEKATAVRDRLQRYRRR